MAKWNGETDAGSPYFSLRQQGYSHKESVGIIEGTFTKQDVNISRYVKKMIKDDAPEIPFFDPEEDILHIIDDKIIHESIEDEDDEDDNDNIDDFGEDYSNYRKV